MKTIKKNIPHRTEMVVFRCRNGHERTFISAHYLGRTCKKCGAKMMKKLVPAVARGK